MADINRLILQIILLKIFSRFVYNSILLNFVVIVVLNIHCLHLSDVVKTCRLVNFLCIPSLSA